MLGTSTLRRILRRPAIRRSTRAQMGGVVALVGRLVDIAATLTQLSFEPSSGSDQTAIAELGRDRREHSHRSDEPANSRRDSYSIPMTNSRLVFHCLREMEKPVDAHSSSVRGFSIDGRIPAVFGRHTAIDLVSPDAFVNPEHLKFALKGCLAASAVTSSTTPSPGRASATAVTTCLLTALSTIGASRQKQILRLRGRRGGRRSVSGWARRSSFCRHLDSIAGFTLLFMLVTALASWFMTSSPRLSYFGLQVALAFYLINLQEFAMQTSLAVARDRVVGVLLGLFMMWLVFDQLWGAPAAVEMKRAFISTLRLLAQLAREPLRGTSGGD